MTTFDFENKLRLCNPRLRVVKNTPHMFAGVEQKGREEDGALCGISKLGLTDNRTLVGRDGRIHIRSVRDALLILVARKAVDRAKAERVFDIRLDRKWPSLKEG